VLALPLAYNRDQVQAHARPVLAQLS
jgi:hypothetical protein